MPTNRYSTMKPDLNARDREKEFAEAIGTSVYNTAQIKHLYDAMTADRAASIVQLTCVVCGLDSWQQQCNDMALDFARDSDDEELIAEIAALPDKASREARAMQWYVERHSCADHSAFSDLGCQGWRDRERHENQMREIREALNAPV